jgi:hypothetical protein
MNSQYTCLTCGAAIPLDDINVSGDIALCRKCGNTSAFSLVSGASGLVGSEGAGEPPRGVWVERDPMGGGVTITHKRVSPLALFFIPFTLLFGGGSFCAFYGTQLMSGTFVLSDTLAGIPFMIGAAILICVTLTVLFGKYAITLRRGEGTVFFGVGKLGRMRHFTYSRDAKISLRPSDIKRNNTPVDEIVVLNRGDTFGMCALLPDKPKRFIAGLLQREIARGT